MKFYVYILQSKVDEGFYVGISSDVMKRLNAHRSGSTRSTKHRKPFRLIHVESHLNRQVARKREKYLKSLSGADEKRKIIENCRLV